MIFEISHEFFFLLFPFVKIYRCNCENICIHIYVRSASMLYVADSKNHVGLFDKTSRNYMQVFPLEPNKATLTTIQLRLTERILGIIYS